MHLEPIQMTKLTSLTLGLMQKDVYWWNLVSLYSFGQKQDALDQPNHSKTPITNSTHYNFFLTN